MFVKNTKLRGYIGEAKYDFEGILLLSMLALSIEDRYVWGKNT